MTGSIDNFASKFDKNTGMGELPTSLFSRRCNYSTSTVPLRVTPQTLPSSLMAMRPMTQDEGGDAREDVHHGEPERVSVVVKLN